MKSRWYDQDPEMGIIMDILKDCPDGELDSYLKKILAAIKNNEPSLLQIDKSSEFPLQLLRRRWYDADPYLWLAVNAMERASEKTRLEIKGIFKT